VAASTQLRMENSLQINMDSKRAPIMDRAGFGPKGGQVQYVLHSTVLWRDRNDHNLHGLQCESGSDRTRTGDLLHGGLALLHSVGAIDNLSHPCYISSRRPFTL